MGDHLPFVVVEGLKMVRPKTYDTLETRRLVLRPFEPNDAARVAMLIGNWNVVRMLAMPPYPYFEADAMRYITNTKRFAADPKRRDWAIARDGLLVGGVGHSANDAGIAIGYWLGEPYWGNGYMTEAVGAVVRRFFADKIGDELISGLFADNPASWRIQEKLGFEIVGRGPRHCIARRADVDHIDTRLTRQRHAERAE